MLKTALLFAGAGLALVLLAPGLLPALQQQIAASPAPERALRAEAPAAPQPQPTRERENGFREVQVADNGANQYVLDALVDGQNVHFLVDTGANIVSLNSETARRLGLYDSPSVPHYKVSTANGQAIAYGVKLRSIDLGSIYVSDVDALVAPNLGEMNLLGMSFLRRLSAVEQRQSRLILRQ